MKHSLSTSPIVANLIIEWQQQVQQRKKELNQYAEQLMWWNSRINLLSRDVSRETIMEHIRHSCLIALNTSFRRSDLIIDAGTGGGLPGIPLAILYPDKEFILNDIVGKKITAVKQIARSLSLKNVAGAARSIERLESKERYTLVSKHAFKIPDLISYQQDKNWESILLLKGASDVESELAKTSTPLQVHIQDISILKPEEFYKGKSLVEIKKYD